ncbi:unnamed protein product [Rotaria sordida]|uniref:Uncharacterized protein n=1 Tax=Rotaria sordida TaxID=392033 RepID=A0A818JS83_9BILA|nr:unnamed protein product [Rotaria sordida]CAF1034719.1 unnamed protein product [Rotaria sordida]CAF3547683.1 unnamed protein product [Rotaria sordida]CAF3941150.1 unnamed protein product [Rotaria sordida]
MNRPTATTNSSQHNVCTYAQQSTFKIMLLGDSGVGKTCLLVRFKDDTFLSGSFIATVGIDFRNKTIVINNKQVKLQIYDTAGQERFRSVAHSYYRDANALLLLYDVSSIISFNHVRDWLGEIKEFAQSDVIIMLIANKVDKTNERVVTREMGEKLAKEYDVPYVETSAKTGLNVEFCFKAVSQALLEQTAATTSYGQSASKTLNSLVQLNNRTSKHSVCCLYS